MAEAKVIFEEEPEEEEFFIFHEGRRSRMKISLMLMLIATVVLAVPVHPQAESRTPGYVTSGQMHVTISRWRQVLAIHRMVEVSNESLSFGRNYHRPFIADWLPCLGHKAKGLRINRV